MLFVSLLVWFDVCFDICCVYMVDRLLFSTGTPVCVCVCDEIQREIEGEGETEEVMICMMLKEYSYVTLYR